MKLSELTVKRFINSDFEENLYVVWRVGSTDCVIIDPGMEPEEAIDFIRDRGLVPKAILITHGHYDHIGGLNAVKKEWPDAVVFIGEKERYKLTDPTGNLSAHFGLPAITRDADRSLADGEKFTVAGMEFEAILIPGHSAGHLVYQISAEDGAVVFVGDVIFAGSVGRTDFPDGETSALISGIKTKLLSLPDGTVFFTGHGPETRVETERATNPWL